MVADDTINIRNSRQLIDKLRNVVLDENDIIVSFDAVSLFTRIPVLLAIKIIDERWPDIEKYTSIKKDSFIEATKFCLESGYCNYNNSSYAQVQGVAMGSPLSPIIAEFVLDKLFRTIRDNFEVKFLTKYVDGSICIVNKDFVDAIFDTMNNFHPRLKFTCEKEDENGSINFLDVTIIKNELCNFYFKHYRKPTHSGRIINYHSNQPRHFKVNTTKCILKNWLSLSPTLFFIVTLLMTSKKCSVLMTTPKIL